MSDIEAHNLSKPSEAWKGCPAFHSMGQENPALTWKGIRKVYSGDKQE